MHKDEQDSAPSAKKKRGKRAIALIAIALAVLTPIAAYMLIWSHFHVTPDQARQNFASVLEITDFDNSGNVLDEEYQLASDLFGNSRYDGVISGSAAYSSISDRLIESQTETGLSCETTDNRYTSCRKDLFTIELYISEGSKNTVLTMYDNGKEKRFE